MRLVILTNMYPYGDQEAFIEPEMKVLENQFDEIHIITLAKQGDYVTRYIPSNAKIIHVNNENSKFEVFLKCISPSAIKEILFAKKEYNYNYKESFRLLFNFYERYCSSILNCLEKENRSNTIFYSYWLSHLSYALAIFKKKHSDAFCISRAHRVDNFISFKASLYRREILKTLNGVYPISLEGKKEIENRILPYIHNYNRDVKVFHLGVELTEIINPAKKTKEMQIVSCSFIHKIKRLDIIIDALANIDDISINWTHFGGGQDEIMIRAMAKEKLGQKNNIRFNFAGQTMHDDIMNYYRENHVDLFINSSDHEGIPVSVMEAMASSIVCVARDVGGNGELIKNNENGFLLKEEASFNDFSTVITQVYHLNDIDVSRIKQNAMKKIREDFASPFLYERFVKYIIESYKNSLSKSGV